MRVLISIICLISSISAFANSLWLYLEKARKRAPHNADINYNLDSIVTPSTFDNVSINTSKGIGSAIGSVARLKSVNFWSWLAFILCLCGFSSLIAYRILKAVKFKKITFYTGISILFIGLLCFGASYLHRSYLAQNNLAVIMINKSMVMSEPSDNSENLFELHEGTTVNIIDSNTEWMRIEVNQKQGWMLKEGLAIVD